MDETRATELTEAIYTEVYGDIDNKYFRNDKTTEIYDWLVNGDVSDDDTVESLVTEWREYTLGADLAEAAAQED